MLQGIFNFMNLLGTSEAENSLSPLYKAMSTIGPWAMAIVVALGMVYGTIIGVKFSKSEDSKERAALQKALINGIIGFVAIFLLIAIMYAIRGPLTDFMSS